MKSVVIAVLLSAILALPALAQDNAQSQSSAQPSVANSDPSQTAATPTGSPVDSAAATAPTASAPKATHNKD
jgi:hypothetical protein